MNSGDLSVIRDWFEQRQAVYAQSGITSSIVAPQEIQIKKSLVIHLLSEKVAGTIYLWETGELDTELVDLSKPVSVPAEECYRYQSIQLDDVSLVIEHLDAFLESVLRLQQ